MRASAVQSSKSKSHIHTEDVSSKTTNGKSVQLFTDNRPETVTQRKFKEMANNGTRFQKVAQLQSIVNSTVQRQEPEEEELLQGRFKTVQRQGLEEEELIQGKFNTIQRQELEEEEPLQGKFQPIQKKGNNSGMPDNLKNGIENLSGIGMDDVKVHYNSDKPAGLQAHAYAQGTDIHVAPGQEKNLPHEAWHVVQQKQGRVKPTMQMMGNVNVNDDKGLEKEADVMGAKAIFHTGNKDTKRTFIKKNNLNFAQPLQRVILSIGDPQRSGVDFPALASRLLEKKGVGAPKSFGSYQHPEPHVLSKVFGSKEVLYLVTHGSPSGIIGFNDANSLATSLKAKNLTSKTVSKIILVACSTGSGSSGTGGSFGLDLARLTGISVYCSNKPIFVHSQKGEGLQPTNTPTHFSIADAEVKIVNGEGLIEYKSTDTSVNQKLL